MRHGPKRTVLVDPRVPARYCVGVNAVEFTAELSGSGLLKIPSEAAAQLPKSGIVRVIVLTSDDNEDVEWRRGAYQQFLRDDPPEDAVYDSCR